MGGAGGEMRMWGGKAAKRGTRRETGTPESLEAYVGRVLTQDFSQDFLHYKILLARVSYKSVTLQVCLASLSYKSEQTCGHSGSCTTSCRSMFNEVN